MFNLCTGSYVIGGSNSTTVATGQAGVICASKYMHDYAFSYSTGKHSLFTLARLIDSLSG